ncbi:MAG: tRNA (adenosine(37)-N6)-threonylcarbamoyltransferase complex transferase subunit TsaD [candidate division SR1 bacterium]|nr:tRNA (adenosine(37)-N6)-threonylcarbamoyltransferase complex transferase subunit TsaD [candidate division SR1 bacterium]
MKTLAIETSCDDTSLGIIDFDGQSFSVDSLLAYSQIDDHQRYGGVVPELASRLHFDKIIEVLQSIGLDKIKGVDFISVTTHPGLPGSLVVGKTVASLLSSYFAKPLVHVNHIYGHIFSLLLERNISDIQFPLAVLTASGGHNDIYIINNSEFRIQNSEGIERKEFGGYKIAKVGYTLDDAAGECFDKVSRMLGGPYPGGQRIAEKALQGHANSDVEFKRIFLSKEGFEFSFSGMKSQVSFLLKKLVEGGEYVIPEQLICDIAYEFQEAVVEVMAKKLVKAGIAFDAKTLGLAGGVSCNDRLREYLNEYGGRKERREEGRKRRKLRPMKKVYSTDNAAMIGVAGIVQYINEKGIINNE